MAAVPDPLQALCAALGLGPDPAQVLGPLARLYAELDDELARRTRGLDLPCRAGCDACCHEAVFVSAPEFLAIGGYLLETAAPARRAEVVQEMVALAERFEDELELLEALPAGPERDEVARRVRFRCPLLGLDGRCTVYPARELNGRTFGGSRDELRDEPYGCDLTHARLRVLAPSATGGLPGARAARRRLVAEVPGAGAVRVYPWWFRAYGALLVPGSAPLNP